MNTNPIAQLNGNFIFFGSETGVDFADFLLGIPSQYNQSQLQPFYGCNKYVGIYGQDSWRIKKNLTLNYGCAGIASSLGTKSTTNWPRSCRIGSPWFSRELRPASYFQPIPEFRARWLLPEIGILRRVSV